MKLTSNLRRIRMQKNLSQSQLSKMSNVKIRIIQCCEQGSRDINKVAGETLYNLAKALDCSIEDLLEL